MSRYELERLARQRSPNVRGLQRAAFQAWEGEAEGRSPSDEQLVAWADALDLDIVLAIRTR